MRPEDIAFIVPSKDGENVLYLKDGRIITIGTRDGMARSVARLPSFEQIDAVDLEGELGRPNQGRSRP